VPRLRFLPAAIADLGDIHAHVAEHRPHRGDALVDQLVDRVGLLREHPRAGQARAELGPGIRSLVEAPT